ncbi:MAG: SoxR reducing system RseC family protein [Rhodocyclaceae bacterium]|nr:SoxR reducing system RseC family protein [Rhodocyclaceae bacterium]
MNARQATILTIADGLATLRVEVPAACGSCASRSHCGTTARTIQLPAPPGVQPGERVMLAMPAGALARSALLAYLLPAGLTLIGAVSLAAAGDLAAVAGAGGGLGLGLIAQRVLARRSPCTPAFVSPSCGDAP